MREILFRGKRIDNGKWIEGYYCKHEKRQICPVGDSLKDDEIEHLIIFDGFADWNMPKELQCAYIIPETVGEYTGLRDKNCERVFEGDIVKCTDTINGISMTAIVEFGNPNGENNWGFQLRRIHGDKANPDILLWVETETDGVYAEVIGNIHDNPELLKITE